MKICLYFCCFFIIIFFILHFSLSYQVHDLFVIELNVAGIVSNRNRALNQLVPSDAAIYFKWSERSIHEIYLISIQSFWSVHGGRNQCFWMAWCEFFFFFLLPNFLCEINNKPAKWGAHFCTNPFSTEFIENLRS